jgi:hypothetical protein
VLETYKSAVKNIVAEVANLDKAFQDGTHHNKDASYELSKCTVPGIRGNKLDLARHIADDFQMIDRETTIPRSRS